MSDVLKFNQFHTGIKLKVSFVYLFLSLNLTQHIFLLSYIANAEKYDPIRFICISDLFICRS